MNKSYTPMFKLICRFLKDNNIPYREDIFDKMNAADQCLSVDWFIVRYIEKIPPRDNRYYKDKTFFGSGFPYYITMNKNTPLNIFVFGCR